MEYTRELFMEKSPPKNRGLTRELTGPKPGHRLSEISLRTLGFEIANTSSRLKVRQYLVTYFHFLLLHSSYLQQGFFWF